MSAVIYMRYPGVKHAVYTLPWTFCPAEEAGSNQVPWVSVRLIDTLSDGELREIESEENEDRKDFTPGERGRTFKAAKQTVADVKKAAEVLSAQNADKQRVDISRNTRLPEQR
jgi:hypothetical protein